MEKLNESSQAARWLLDNWEKLQDFHFLLESVGAFSPNNPNREAIIQRHCVDLLTLWAYAHEEFLRKLLQKRTPASLNKTIGDRQKALIELLRSETPEARNRLLNAFEAYCGELELAYLRWVQEKPDGNIVGFLAQAPALILPSSRGGDRRASPSTQEECLTKAAQDFVALQACLKQQTKRSYYHKSRKKNDLKVVLQEVLGTLEGAPLDDWLDDPPRQLALSASAWKHGISASYLEKRLPQILKKAVLAVFADLRKSLTFPCPWDMQQKLRELRVAVLL